MLGGAEISRSHIPKHLAHFIQGDGTIPVEVFAGADAAWMAASDRWQQLVASGVQAVLTHGQLTLEPSGQAWHMAVDGLYKRTRALVMSRRVQALVLVVQTDELLGTGLPLEAVSQVTIVDQGLLPVRSDGGELAALRIQAALRQLVSWQRLPAASQPKARWPSP